MTEKFANNYESTLNGSITNSATTLTATSVTGAPTSGEFRLLILAEGANTDEIVTVTGVSGSVFTIVRASEATAGVQTASAHASGATIKHVLTAGALNIASTGFIGAKAYHNTTQTGAGVRSLNSEDFDTDGFHDTSTNNSRMTIPAGLGGKYLVRGFVWGGTDKIVRILKNGSTVTGSNVLFKTGGECSLILDLIPTDYVEVYTDDTGATGHASAVEAMNSLELMKLDSGKVGSGIGAKGYNSAVQSVSNNTDTALTLDSEDFDTDGFHSIASNTSRMTIPAGLGGKYLVVGSTYFTAGTAGTIGRAIRIKKNGATFVGGDSRFVSSAACSLVTTAIPDLVAGDYVELMAFQDSGGALDVGNTARDVGSTLSIMRLDSISTAAGTLLSAHEDSTNTNYSTTSTTVADVDATNMVISFVFPASGRVLIRFCGYADLSTSGFYGWGLREGTTNIKFGAAVRDSGTQGSTVVEFLVSGTPGVSTTYKWSHAVSTGGQTGRILGGAGAAVSTYAGERASPLITVWAA